jgi:hypothetical protein
VSSVFGDGQPVCGPVPVPMIRPVKRPRKPYSRIIFQRIRDVSTRNECDAEADDDQLKGVVKKLERIQGGFGMAKDDPDGAG